MSNIPKELGKRYILAWKKAAIVLANTRKAELPLIDTTKGLVSLLPAFNAAVKARPPLETSGLIVQQKIFSRARSL